ncbi:MAG: hypothetical protein ABEJ31_00340 [Haloarculaceae archaeon]
MHRSVERVPTAPLAAAVSWGVFAWALHRTGAAAGWYLRYGWFQNLTHACSASALAALLAVAPLWLGYDGRRLAVFVVAGAAVGALGWEVVEYLGLLDPYGIWLQFHSVHDAAVDMTANAVGVTGTLLVLWVRTGQSSLGVGLTRE